MRTAPDRITVTGNYAGPVSRLLAAVVDAGVVVASYTIGLAGVRLLYDVFGSTPPVELERGVLAVVAFTLWSFLYVFVSLAISGQTVGKSIVGLRVVEASGATLRVRAALLRTVLLPVSGLFFGIGFVPIVLHRENRAFHDLVAGTAVVYDWGQRSAQLPGPLSQFLSRRGAPAAPDRAS